MTDKTQAEKAALKAGFTAIEWGDGWWRTEHSDPHGWASGESVEELMGFISGWRAAQEAVSSKDEAREGALATFQATSDTLVGPVEINITCSSDGKAAVEGVLADGTKVPVDIKGDDDHMKLFGILTSEGGGVSIEGVHGSGEEGDSCP